MNQIEYLKQRVLQVYHSTKFTLAELLVIAVLMFWLTKNSILYIIELL